MPEEKKDPEASAPPGSGTEIVEAILAWYRGLTTQWPDVFPQERLREYWTLSKTVLAAEEQSLGTPEGQMRFQAILKAGMLRILRGAVNDCTACGLYIHRLKGRAVLDDGDPAADPFQPQKSPQITGPVSATLMVLGSHPGALEGRTALPFTSATVLAGSACGSLCAEYGSCFPARSVAPEAGCAPRWVGKPGQELPMASERAADPQAWGEPGAGILDQVLVELGEWRSSWNPRQRRRATRPGTTPREGTVYLTDLVKCPTSGPLPGEPPRSVKGSEIRACHRWLEMQVYILQPRAVLALGSLAQEAIVTVKSNAAPGISGPHPRWIARQPKELRPEGIKKLKEAIREARRIADQGPLPAELEPVTEPLVTAPPAIPAAAPELDPLAPRHATPGTTFPDVTTEAWVKGTNGASPLIDPKAVTPLK